MRAPLLDHGRRTITHTCPIHRCVSILAARNEKDCLGYTKSLLRGNGNLAGARNAQARHDCCGHSCLVSNAEPGWSRRDLERQSKYSVAKKAAGTKKAPRLLALFP